MTPGELPKFHEIEDGNVGDVGRAGGGCIACSVQEKILSKGLTGLAYADVSLPPRRGVRLREPDKAVEDTENRGGPLALLMD